MGYSEVACIYKFLGRGGDAEVALETWLGDGNKKPVMHCHLPTSLFPSLYEITGSK